MSNYKQKAKQSFKSKWKIYLFEKIINSETNQINYPNFETYQLTDEAIKKYVSVYWQQPKDHQINRKTIDAIYKTIKEYENSHAATIAEFEGKYIKNEFPRIFSESDFKDLQKAEKCAYCEITKQEINALGEQQKLRKKNFRGWNFEVDRVAPNKEYSKANCVMSCYWCNNAKTDEFSASEFKAIGQAIGNALRNRLKSTTP